MIFRGYRVLIRFIVGLFIILSSLMTVHACDFDQQVENIERNIKTARQVLDRQSLDDPEIVKHHLSVMYTVDQEARQLFSAFDNSTTRKILEKVDLFNTEYLKAILEVHGWITISKFGKESDNLAWLLVQHADHDPEFQRRWLLQLQQLYPCGETDKKHYAYLYDRIALKSEAFGLKQRYGTQVQIIGDQIKF